MAQLISPSFLSADFLHLADNVEMINKTAADWIHLDVMDGVFVPNISFGFPVLKAIAKVAKKPMDVHYMIVHPENYIQKTAELGAMMMTVHAEACEPHTTIEAIHKAGMKAGIAINPETPVSSIEDIIGIADMILIMTVHPGFGGQKFIEACLDKVREVRRIANAKGCQTHIQVDGGVDEKTAPQLVEAGADVLVSGSYIFRSENPAETILGLKAIK